jgi:site-specific DNA recombinase
MPTARRTRKPAQTAAGTPAAIYARLSSNRTDDPSGSTLRQLEACRTLAADRGYEVVAELVDDGISASSGKRRPGYEALCDLIAERQVGVVLAWHPDRLHRRPAELETFLDLVDDAGVDVATCTAGDWDLSTASGRMFARQLGILARYEAEHRSERTRAGHDDLADEGYWHGGVRPYGYRPVVAPEDVDKRGKRRTILEVVPAEAEVVLEMVDRILAGDAPGRIAADLNRRGVPTVKSSKWHTSSVTTLVRSATLTGRRVHRGEVVGAARWPAIVDDERHAAVCAKLAQRPGREQPARVALLTGGRLRCDRCGTPMTTARRGNGVRLYRCTDCYAVIAAEPLEALITEALHLRTDEMRLPDGDVGEHETIRALQAELVELAEMLGAGTIRMAEYRAAQAGIVARLDEAQAAATQSLGSALVGLGDPGAVRAAWPDLSLDRRRAIVDVYIGEVRIARATRRGPGLDPDRVDVRWRS